MSHELSGLMHNMPDIRLPINLYGDCVFVARVANCIFRLAFVEFECEVCVLEQHICPTTIRSPKCYKSRKTLLDSSGYHRKLE